MHFTLPDIHLSNSMSLAALNNQQKHISRAASFPSLTDSSSSFFCPITSPLSADAFLESLHKSPQSFSPISQLYSETKAQHEQNHENFSLTIKHFIEYAENRPSQSYSITTICNEFGFQRRRFYDVINVLEITGCCKRINVDTITWFGRQNVHRTLFELVRISQNNLKSSLSNILPKEKIITISHLTKVYLLIFSILNQKQLDIRATAQVIAKENGRFKTTLCKLYQITHILCAAGILAKSDIPSIVYMNDEYFVPTTKSDTLQSFPSLHNQKVPDTLKIENLLSSPFQNQQNYNIGFCLNYGGSYLPLPLVSPIKC